MQEIQFEVVYVCAGEVFRRYLTIGQGASVSEAIAMARTECPDFPPEAWACANLAIYGTLVEDRSIPVAEGDRLELLRPLIIDPVEARRKRAQGGT